MAMATEGKTMEEFHDECRACEVNFAIKYCVDCKMKLCSICSSSHRKIPSTKGHTLNDIHTPKKGAQSKFGVTKCYQHKNESLMFLCKPCVELICTSCKPNHGDHELLPLTDNPKSYHKVCSNHLQQLLDDLNEVEAIKSILEQHIQTYDEAITVVDQWELNLLKLVNDKAAKLRNKIKASKDDKVKQLSDKMDGLFAKIKDINKTITKLTDVLKSTDPQILSTELSKSQELIKKLEDYKAELKPLPQTGTVEKLLTHGDKIKDVGNNLDTMFHFTDFAPKVPIKHQGHLPVAEWHFTAANGGTDLSQYGENQVTLKGLKYGPGPNGETNGAVILPTSKDQSMIVINPTDKLRFTSNMTFFTHVYVDGNSSGPLFEYNTGVTSSSTTGARVWVCSDDTSLIIWNSSHHWVGKGHVLTPNSWHKIAIVFCASNISVYINGCNIQNGNLNFSGTGSGHIHFGCRAGESPSLQGRIATATFFNVALSESEVQQL